MADVSKLNLKGTIYDFKDATARELIANLPVPVQFKGTLGTGGTVEVLPVASSTTIGYSYKVITKGEYEGELYYPDDLFICSNDLKWVGIHSGDNNYQQKLTHELNAGGGIQIDNETQRISLVDPLVPRFKGFILTGDGTNAEFTITHGFTTKDIFIQVYSSDGQTIVVDSERTSLDEIKIKFNTIPESGATYRVMLLAFEEVTEETKVLYTLPVQLGLEIFESNLL